MHKLLKIDELVVGDHFYLSNSESCYYFMEYTARGGYSASDANNLIFNFKKSPRYKGQQSWRWKLSAIKRIGRIFSESLPGFLDLENCTLVPIPPSKTKEHPLHDDRMLQALQIFALGKKSDVRELLLLNEDMEAVHKAENRPRPRELQDIMSIDREVGDNLAENIILFDDLITTGAHYIACRDLIREYYPDKSIHGIFIARRALPHEASDFKDFFD